jgi:hypothetical protein
MQPINKFKDQIIIPLIRFQFILSVIFMPFCFIGCSNDVATIKNEDNGDDKPVADVISVTVNGEPNAYEFSVSILSPDTGCDQYADWWEVLSEDSALIYRRILAHSHVNEQPFVRSGGPVPIAENDVVYIRGHMHPGGYGGNVFKGSVQDGFEKVTVPSDFALGVENEDPQPDGCAF